MSGADLGHDVDNVVSHICLPSNNGLPSVLWKDSRIRMYVAGVVSPGKSVDPNLSVVSICVPSVVAT